MNMISFIGITCSDDPNQDCRSLCIVIYVHLPHRPFFVLCDVLSMA